MFAYSSNLSRISTLQTEWGGDNGGAYWVEGVASEGFFFCPSALGNDTTIYRGTYKCPENWLVGNFDVDGS